MKDFTENWYQTAEYVLTDNVDKLSRGEIDHLLAETTYDMAEDEAEGFFSSIGNIAQNAAPLIGTAVGAYVGGVPGAQLGGTLGSAIANKGQNKPKPQGISSQRQNVPSHQSNAPNIKPSLQPTGVTNSNYSKVAKELLALIKKPGFILGLLQAITENLKSRNTSGSSEQFDYYVHNLKNLTEKLLTEQYVKNAEDPYDYYETID